MAQQTRILIVDDDPTYRLFLRRFLTQEPDFDIVGEAANGEEAVRATESLQPDVVLLDEWMPGMTGSQAMPQILKARRVAVIAHSSFSDLGLRSRMLALGARSFIPKEGGRAALVDAIRDHARARELRMEDLQRVPQRDADDTPREPERVAAKATVRPAGAG